MESWKSQIERSTRAHSSISVDNKYKEIRNEALNAGILLKETDEQIDEIIYDGLKIKSHAYDIRSNALRFYRNLIQSERMIQFCQWTFVVIVITLSICLILKNLLHQTK